MSRTTSFQLDEELYENLKEHAEEIDKKQSEVIRTALENHLDENRDTLEDRVDELEEQIQEIRTALIKGAASDYSRNSPGDFLPGREE